MNILQLYLGPIFNSAGGQERVFCYYASVFGKENNVINVVSDPKGSEPFYSIPKETEIINLYNNKYSVKLPFRIRIAHILTHSFRKYYNPRQDYYYRYIGQCIANKIDFRNIDVAICYGLMEYFVLLKAKFPIKKIVLMFHGSDIDILLKNLSRKDIETLKNVGAIQILQEEFLEQTKKYGLSNVSVIGNVVPQPREFCEYSSKRIITVGRLDKSTKRQHLIIEAFSRINKRFPDWKLCIVGGNALPPEYEQFLHDMIRKHKLSEQVEILGARHDVDELLIKASIFAFASRTEGFALALMEGMSRGLPAVAFSDAVGIKSIVVNEKTGLIAKSVDDFADCLDRLILDETYRAKLGRNASITTNQFREDIILAKWKMLLAMVKEKSFSGRK